MHASRLHAQSSPAFAERAHLYGEGDPTHQPTILQNITSKRYEDVATAKAQVSVEQLKAQAAAFDQEHGGPLDLRARLEEERKAGKMGVAAEFKRASPSKGDIAVDLDAAEQGIRYASVGAAVISVLTELNWFKGSLEDMKAVRLATQAHAASRQASRPAVLRKDFLVDEYQVYEARANGADTVLLIVAILEVSQLKHLIDVCRSVGIEPLVEVHTEEELDIALAVGSSVLGINNRNLHTFKLDLATTERLTAKAAAFAQASGQPSPMILSLSGISGPEDVDRYRQIGVAGVLVGEALMRAADPAAAITALLGQPSTAARPVVKVCGVMEPEAAVAACKAGAGLVGVIFAPGSARKVDVQQAKAVVGAVRAFGEREKPIRVSTAAGGGDALARLRDGAEALRLGSRRTPLVVGVFQDQPTDEVQQLAEAAGVDLVQFHGTETDAQIDAVGLPAIRVMHLPPATDSQDASTAERVLADIQRSTAQNVVAVLLDTSVGAVKGGTGATFDWSVAAALAAEPTKLPVLVAGGLADHNVAAALQAAGPNALGVDASSGLETEVKGQKDLARVTAYVQAALGQQPMTEVGSAEYYKGFFESSLDADPARGDGLEQAIKLAGSASLVLGGLLVAFLLSNGLL